MNTYTTALAALDVKVGRVNTIDDWRRVGEKSVSAPGTLTDDDLIILEGFGGAKSAAEARARRLLALNPPAPPDPPLTKTQTAPIPPDNYPRTEESWGDYVKRCPDIPVPLALFDNIRTFVQEMNTKNVERNQRLDTLEQRNAALEARLAAIDARPELKYVGVWRDDATYAAGALATHSGGLWLAISATTSGTPGTPDSGWQLVVKRGGV